MLAKWVYKIRGMEGRDFLGRVLETWGILTLMPIVVVWAVVGVRRSKETSRGQQLGWSGTR
jgi:hypothetical protein